MAIPLFLSAPRQNRIISKHAAFYFHQAAWDFGPGNIGHTGVKEADILLDNAVEWQRNIVKSETDFKDSDFQALKLFKEPNIIDAPTAVKFGIAKAIAEPHIPAASQPRIACA